jgi:hypothetical protein
MRWIFLLCGLCLPVFGQDLGLHNIPLLSQSQTYGLLTSNMLVWWKSDSITTATNKQQLGSAAGGPTWFDSSGHGYDMKTNSGNGPMFLTSQVGSLPSVSTTNSGVLRINQNLVLSTNFTIIAVYKTRAGTDGIIIGNSAVNRQVRINRSGANQCSFFDGTTEGISATMTTAKTDKRMTTWIRLNGAITYMDDLLPLTGGTAALSTTFDTWGNNPASSIPYDGDVYELVIYDKAQTQATITNLYRGYFQPKWQLP